MATKESTQGKLKRNRPPRVHITYDVEIGDATQQKEIPFVLGVVGDYKGHSPNKTRLKDRKFVQIDRDNFDDVLRGMAPSLAMQVDNKLDETGDSKLSVSLQFNCIDDFSPENVARQVGPLRELLDTRTRLENLKNKAVGNDAFEEMLDEIARDPEQLRRIRQDQATADKTEGNKE
jgi:type VI secretion system protein ImpB